MLKSKTNTIIQILKYGVFGGAGVLFDFCVYTLFVLYCDMYMVGNVVGYMSGTILSFYLNSTFNFKKFDRLKLRFAMFVAIAISGLLLSIFILYTLVNYLGVFPIYAKVIAIPAVVLMQFLLNKRITFSERA